MKIYDHRNNTVDEVEKRLSVDEFFNESWDNNFLNLREGDGYKIVVFDNVYFDEHLDAPINTLYELTERQWQSEVLIVHIFRDRVVLMI